VFTLGVLTAPVTVLAHDPPPETEAYFSGEVGRRVVEFARACESVGFSGAVLAAKDGAVLAAVGVGSADLEGTTPITPATLFEIASVTKPFTALAVMQLAQDGRLSLDDPIGKHLPGIPDACAAISIRHLLQHTSGIPGANSQGGGDDLAIVLPMFLKGGPQHEPGTHWEYWNQGYALLSEIIAAASGESYTDYCRRAIFEPASMNISRFTGDSAPDAAVVAVGRSKMGPPRSALEHPYGSYGFQYRGMGGLVTNVWDLWRWDRALHGNELLADESKEEMFKAGLGDYGLGWFIRTDRSGRIVQSHGGAVRGFVCEVRRYPQQDAALFVLCNRDDVPARQVADGIEALLFGDRPRIVTPPSIVDPALVQEIVGRYEDEKRNVLTVEADGKVTRAAVKWASGPVTRAFLGLDAEGKIVLYEWASAIEVTPIRDEQGAVTALSIAGHPYKRSDAKPQEVGPAPVPPASLAPLDAALATSLSGVFTDPRGTELRIRVVDGRTHADIHWGPPDGPITHGRIGRNAAGETLFDDFSATYRVEIERDEQLQVTAIAILVGDRRQLFKRDGSLEPER